MNLSVSDASPAPLYRQIFEQLSAAILRGELHGGEPLPPIRTVAAELRVSVISVKRAWEELDREGLIVAAVGRGSFVAALSPQTLREKRRALLLDRLGGALDYARGLGADNAEIEEALRQLL